MSNTDITSAGLFSVELGQLSVLGTGLWGLVFDLEDGTALKLARRRCAGIGDGLSKIKREADVLRAIHATGYRSTLAIAEVLGWGERSNQDLAAGAPSLWLRTTIVPGRVRTSLELQKLSKQAARTICASIAGAITAVHKMLQQSAPNLEIPTATEMLQGVVGEMHNDPEGKTYATRLLKILESLEDKPSPVIHGDFNLSNVLFEGSTVCSVVDFAETRRGFYEEDLAAIIAELPSYRNILIEEFESVTGRSVIKSRLDYGLAMKAFFSFIIARRLGNDDQSIVARCLLEKTLKEIFR